MVITQTRRPSEACHMRSMRFHDMNPDTLLINPIDSMQVLSVENPDGRSVQYEGPNSLILGSRCYRWRDLSFGERRCSTLIFRLSSK